ncbi:MAG: XisI protein [Rhizonema sp. PD38]|nr:XisI protein [Rhizonema sp. PD38]
MLSIRSRKICASSIAYELIERYSFFKFYKDIQFETVFYLESDRYLVMILGRENKRRVHGCLIHVDIINGKIWIQRDGTEEGVASELVKVGVPKDRIVLGFRSPELRKNTDFAIA